MKVASTTKKMFEKRLFSFSCLKLYLLGVKYSNLDVEFYFLQDVLQSLGYNIFFNGILLSYSIKKASFF